MNRDAGVSAGWPTGFAALAAALLAVDAGSDMLTGASAEHLGLEAVAAISAGIAAAFAARNWAHERRIAHEALRTANEERQMLASEQQRWRAEAERWRHEAEGAVRGMSDAMDRQFDAWDLSPAEREIALLLVQGLSLKQVGEARATSERTVRQQAQAIYRKAGVAGRAELAAFFLEALRP